MTAPIPVHVEATDGGILLHVNGTTIDLTTPSLTAHDSDVAGHLEAVDAALTALTRGATAARIEIARQRATLGVVCPGCDGDGTREVPVSCAETTHETCPECAGWGRIPVAVASILDPTDISRITA